MTTIDLGDVPVVVDPELRPDEVKMPTTLLGPIRTGSLGAVTRMVDDFNARFAIVNTSPRCLLDKATGQIVDMPARAPPRFYSSLRMAPPPLPRFFGLSSL